MSTNPHRAARSGALAWRDAIRPFFSILILLVLVAVLFDVLLMFFGAVLLAVILRAPSDWLARRTGLDSRVSLGLVLLIVTALLALAFWLVGHSIAHEVREVWQQLPGMIDDLQARVRDIAVVGPAMEQVTANGSPNGVVQSGMATIAATFGALTQVALVAFVAILLAAQPQIYVRGVLHLVPPRRRARMASLLEELGHMLQRWTLGQLCLMTLVGVLTYAGFTLAGIEYAGALGLLAGLLTFIPFLGSFFAGVVAVLMALAQGVDVALYAAAIYAGVQIIENICEPLVQQRAVYLAPALLLFAQAVMAALAGLAGIVLATPLAAVGVVVVKRLYVEGVLGDHTVAAVN